MPEQAGKEPAFMHIEVALCCGDPRAAIQAEQTYKLHDWKAASFLLFMLRILRLIEGSVRHRHSGSIHDKCPALADGSCPSTQTARDIVDNPGQQPYGQSFPGIAIGLSFRGGQLKIVCGKEGLDIAQGLPARVSRFEHLTKKSPESDYGSENSAPAVGASIGFEIEQTERDECAEEGGDLRQAELLNLPMLPSHFFDFRYRSPAKKHAMEAREERVIFRHPDTNIATKTMQKKYLLNIP